MLALYLLLSIHSYLTAHTLVGDHKATIDPALIDLHFDDDATGSIPALGSIKKLVKLTLFFLQLNEPQPSRIQQGLDHSVCSASPFSISVLRSCAFSWGSGTWWSCSSRLFRCGAIDGFFSTWGEWWEF